MSIFKRMKDKFTGDTPHGSQDADSEPTLTAEQYSENGWSCRNSNDWAGAIHNFSMAIELNPYAADFYYGRGVVHNIVGNYWKAMVDLDRALKLYPNHVRALAERGLVNLNLGEPQDALADYHEALHIDPTYVPIHQNKGAALARMGKWSQALACYDLALRLKPDGWENYLNRGEAYRNLDMPGPAVQDYSTYLQHCPNGQDAQVIRDWIDTLSNRASHEPPERTVGRRMWTEFVIVSLFDTVHDLIWKVQRATAFFVVVPLLDGEYGVESVYGKDGLRDRLTEIGDVIGREILHLRLVQFLDLWKPGNPIESTVTEEQAKQVIGQFGGSALVHESGHIIGIYRTHGENYHYPPYPTVLFGRQCLFRREEKKLTRRLARHCPACNSEFAYYKPVMNDDKLVDYACPHCGKSPIADWIEARMYPGRLSKSGFLGTDERLELVEAGDNQVLENLGITHVQIADALERLLDAADVTYEDQIRNRIEGAVKAVEQLVPKVKQRDFSTTKQESPEQAPGSGCTPWIGSVEEVESLIGGGELPPADLGCLVDGLQVFLDVYMGYQLCPWSILHRPWSVALPAPLVRVESHGTFAHVITVPGQRLVCHNDVSYKYADRDFLILDRSTGQYLKGPGLIVHLIREHHFFEGLDSPYRVDPEQAARVLRLI